MSALGDTLAALAAVFGQAHIGWYVFGAQAVSVHGAPRATQDVDVTAAVPADALSQLLEALASAGFAERFAAQRQQLLASGSVVPLVHTSGMEVDMVIAGTGLEAMALDRAELITVEGIPVPVAHPTDLVVMKLLAGRGKDLDDAIALLCSGRVDEAEVRHLLEQFELALGVSDLVARLDEALAQAHA